MVRQKTSKSPCLITGWHDASPFSNWQLVHWFRCFLAFPRFLRAVAYRWLVSWICGCMGWENTRPLPAFVYHAIRQRFQTQNNEKRLSVWTTADRVVVVFFLSPFRKLLSCLIYFLFQLKVKFWWAYVPLYICSCLIVTLLCQNSTIHAIIFLLMNEQHLAMLQLASKPKWITYCLNTYIEEAAPTWYAL